MIEINFINLYYYISQSLLGRITDNIKGIAVEQIELNKIRMHVYIIEPASKIEKENMYSALSETDSYFDTPLDYDIDFTIVGKTGKLPEVRHTFWLFNRYSG